MAHLKTYQTENKIQTLKQAQAQEGCEHKLSKCVGMVIYSYRLECNRKKFKENILVG